MRLVYKENELPVTVGDFVKIGDEYWRVIYFRPPHKPSSEGRVTIERGDIQSEYYVSVIGAEWIDREDRPWETSK